MASWEPLLEELIRARLRDLTAYAHMLTGNRAEAEDLVQDALMATFGRNRSFPNAAAAESYVRRAITSKFIDAKRRSTVERRIFAIVAAHDVDGGASPELLAENATDVGAALAHLTPRERACVVMRYIEHLSVAETADALGLSHGAVKRYVSDAVAKLNGSLGTDVDPDGADWAPVKVKG